MTDKDNGGPAFPEVLTEATPVSTKYTMQRGMSLRDWFAGMAMQGLCANPRLIVPSSFEKEEDAHRAAMKVQGLYAKGAYAVADAMLAERGRDG